MKTDLECSLSLPPPFLPFTVCSHYVVLTDCFDSSKHHLTSSLPLSKKLLDEAMASIVGELSL